MVVMCLKCIHMKVVVLVQMTSHLMENRLVIITILTGATSCIQREWIGTDLGLTVNGKLLSFLLLIILH